MCEFSKVKNGTRKGTWESVQIYSYDIYICVVGNRGDSGLAIKTQLKATFEYGLTPRQVYIYIIRSASVRD